MLDFHAWRTGDARVNGIELTRRIKPPATTVIPSSVDMYEPTGDIIRLSHETWSGRTPEALARAAHECGHAIQRHSNTWAWRVWRVLPVTTPVWVFCIGASAVAWWAGESATAWIFAGIAASLSVLRRAAVLLVEREASRIALDCMAKFRECDTNVGMLRARTELRRVLKSYVTR